MREVWKYLSEGGALVSREETTDGGYRLSMSKYNPLINPQGSLRIAALLADEARSLDPSVAVAWEDLGDAVMAFAVGAELGIPAVRAFDMEGLVQHGGTLPATPRGILVIDAVRGAKAIDALSALLAQVGGTLAGALSLVDIGGAIADVPVKSLVSAPESPVAEHSGA